MKKYVTTFLKSIGVIFISSSIGLLLLMAAFALPTERIDANIRNSVQIFQEEGSYPRVRTISIFGGNTLDNFTDALMLLSAGYNGKETLLNKTLNVHSPHVNKLNPAERLVEIYTNPDVKVRYGSYGRYWHGYLVLLKPLLEVFDYQGIRYLNALLILLTTGALVWVLHRKHMRKYIMPYFITLLLLDPFAIAKSLQFSSVYYIFTLASIILLEKMHKWKLESIVLFFVGIGCATSYFDLLSYPLVTFGIPATFYFCGGNKKDCRVLLLLLGAWCFGYAGMWAAKWIFGTIFGTKNIIKDALNQVALRSSMVTEKGKHISLLSLLGNNLKYIARNPAFIAVIAYIYLNLPMSEEQRHNRKVFLLLSILPVIWYLGASNHSYVHSWMTFREYGISVFALMCMVTKVHLKWES